MTLSHNEARQSHNIPQLIEVISHGFEMQIFLVGGGGLLVFIFYFFQQTNVDADPVTESVDTGIWFHKVRGLYYAWGGKHVLENDHRVSATKGK